MDKEIFKYLYKFYSEGDFVGFHPLEPVLNTLKQGDDFKYFLERLKTIIGHLSLINLIEISETNYGSWGTTKEGNILFDYKNLPVKGRITPEGSEFIEKTIVFERQQKVDNNVILTNKLSWLNVGATILFGIIVTVIQIRSCSKEQEKDRIEAHRIIQDSVRQSQQERHDSLIENFFFYNRIHLADSCIKK